MSSVLYNGTNGKKWSFFRRQRKAKNGECASGETEKRAAFLFSPFFKEKPFTLFFLLDFSFLNNETLYYTVFNNIVMNG